MVLPLMTEGRVEAYIYNFFDDLSMSGDSYISIEKLRNHLRTEVYNTRSRVVLLTLS